MCREVSHAIEVEGLHFYVDGIQDVLFFCDDDCGFGVFQVNLSGFGVYSDWFLYCEVIMTKKARKKNY